MPLVEQLVELAVGDADYGGGFLAGAAADRTSGTAAVADVGEHLQFELAGELSHAGGKVGAHQFGGIGEVAAIRCEGDAVAVADEGGGAVDVGDSIVVGGGAADQAREVAEFVKYCCEEVVVAVGGGAKGGAEEGFTVQGSKFSVVPGGAVDEPAETVGVGVVREASVKQMGEGAGGWATITIETRDVGFGELAGGEIGDRDIEVKWGCPYEEFCPGGDGCVLEVAFMTAGELLERYASGERDFSGVDLVGCNLSDADLPGINLSGANLNGSNLRYANLTGANLSQTDLSQTRLVGATLEGVNLSEANLCQARLAECVLDGADLSRADLSQANLIEASLVNVNLTFAILDGAILGVPLLDGADLTGVDLSKAEIEVFPYQ